MISQVVEIAPQVSTQKSHGLMMSAWPAPEGRSEIWSGAKTPRMRVLIAPPVDIRTKKAWQEAAWLSALPARPARLARGTTRRALKKKAHACLAAQGDTAQHPLQSAEMSAGCASWVNFLKQWARLIGRRALPARKVSRSR